MTVTLFGHLHRDVDKLSVESLYRWLRRHMTDAAPLPGHDSGAERAGSRRLGDSHAYLDELQDEGAGGLEGEADALEYEWRSRAREAAGMSGGRGTAPGAFEDMIDDGLDSKVDWRTALLRFITKEMIVGWTWSRPHKKSFSLEGVYLPDVVRQHLEVVCHVDSSGSISDESLREFFSELRGIIEQFTHIKITLIICDAEIQGEPYELNAGNWSDFINTGKPIGRGGTSHMPVVEWVNEHKPDVKVFITFTDGCSDMEDALPRLPEGCHRLILLTGDSSRIVEDFEKLGEVITIE
jgi:predicted metal-dependent peptidase